MDASDIVRCPKCNSANTIPMYGFGYGGLGAYDVCDDCGHTFNFKRDPEGDDE